MQLVVRKTDLLRELQLFQGIVERKATIPVLSNVVLETADNEVRFSATDLDVAMRSRCPASIVKSGALTLPAKKLYEIVRALPNETDVRIEQTAKGVKVSADQFDSKMQTLPLEDFPVLPTTPGEQTVTFPIRSLQEMVAKTSFAITGEDTRFFLNGAKFILKANGMTLVATDGHRLALVEVDRPLVLREDIGAILPKKTLMELEKLMAEGSDGDIRFEVAENHLFFEIHGRTLISKVIAGTFPAYERVIPKGNDKDIDFERDKLTNAVRRVALMANERSRSVNFAVDKNEVTITSSSAEVGEAREELKVSYDGDPVSISFNAQYMIDFLDVVTTDTVQLSLKDEVTQAIMRPVGADGYRYTYVIMPMRV